MTTRTLFWLVPLPLLFIAACTTAPPKETATAINDQPRSQQVEGVEAWLATRTTRLQQRDSAAWHSLLPLTFHGISQGAIRASQVQGSWPATPERLAPFVFAWPLADPATGILAAATADPLAGTMTPEAWRSQAAQWTLTLVANQPPSGHLPVYGETDGLLHLEPVRMGQSAPPAPLVNPKIAALESLTPESLDTLLAAERDSSRPAVRQQILEGYRQTARPLPDARVAEALSQWLYAAGATLANTGQMPISLEDIGWGTALGPVNLDPVDSTTFTDGTAAGFALFSEPAGTHLRFLLRYPSGLEEAGIVQVTLSGPGEFVTQGLRADAAESVDWQPLAAFTLTPAADAILPGL